jgi:hypothetical protein
MDKLVNNPRLSVLVFSASCMLAAIVIYSYKAMALGYSVNLSVDVILKISGIYTPIVMLMVGFYTSETLTLNAGEQNSTRVQLNTGLGILLAFLLIIYCLIPLGAVITNVPFDEMAEISTRLVTLVSLPLFAVLGVVFANTQKE